MKCVLNHDGPIHDVNFIVRNSSFGFLVFLAPNNYASNYPHIIAVNRVLRYYYRQVQIFEHTLRNNMMFLN